MLLKQVERQYDLAARHYDRFSDIVFGRLLKIEKYRERSLELLGDVRGATVLDVGCGTGRNFPFLAPQVGESGRIIGLDYSQGMLNEARKRVDAQGWHNVELVRGDATALDGVSKPVDALVSIWCYGIVHDLDAALHRAVDVLRPGGRLVIQVFGRAQADRGPLRWLYPLYAGALRGTGMNPHEDLDDAQVRAKWRHGRELLESRLGELHEEHYLNGMGLILAGRKPEAAAAQAVPRGTREATASSAPNPI